MHLPRSLNPILRSRDLCVSLFMAAMLIPLAALAAGDADAGKGLIEDRCRSCHFSDGLPAGKVTPPGFREIIRQHKLIRNEFRQFVTMPHYPMPPKPLSLSQIEDLVAYFDREGYWP